MFVFGFWTLFKLQSNIFFADPKQCRGVTNNSAVKPRKSINSVFASKKFYLDLKAKNLTCPADKQVVSDLQTLGGVSHRPITHYVFARVFEFSHYFYLLTLGVSKLHYL